MRRTLALAYGIAAALAHYCYVTTASQLAHDFSWPWQAARLLLSGHSPYGAPLFHGLGPSFDADPFFYPLPAALVALPLAPLPAPVAGAIFVGLSAALLAYAMPRQIWPALLSAPTYIAIRNGQWATLMAAVGLLGGWWGALLACKPSLGAALWVARPSWRAAAGGLALCLAGLLWLPSWPWEWVATLQGYRHHPSPLLGPPGLLIAPALAILIVRSGLRDWRTRLLLVASLAPQMPCFYDQMPAMLAARTPRHALLLAGASWVIYATFTSIAGTGRGETLLLAALYVAAALAALTRAL